MLKGRFAFEFHDSIYTKNELEKFEKKSSVRVRDNAEINLNMSYKAVERATTLTGCVSVLCNCFTEGKKTKELARRLSHAKRVLDNMVDQDYIRAQAEVEEFMKQSEAKIKYMEKQFELKKEEIVKLADAEKKKFDKNYEIQRMKKDIIIKTRRDLKETLDKVSEIIEYTNQIIENKNDKSLIQVNEQYRECLRDYRQMLNING